VPGLDAQSPDGLLIAAALAGEEEAFAWLVRRYQAALYRAAASRLGRRELAEEVVQETLLCAHRWLATYDSRFSFRTWLWRILLNQCSRQGKREAKPGVRGHGLGHRGQGTGDRGRGTGDRGEDAAAWFSCPKQMQPLDQLLAQEASEQVHALLSRLPEAQADALRLRFFGGLTFAEIAAAMECSEPGAKNRVKSGLLKLAGWLQRSDKQTAFRLDQRQASSLPDEGGDSL
jgi:RNA polymerase sigma-70 factor, ECF subfamily